MDEQTKFSITEAANLAGISRTSLYRNYINKGIISVVRNKKDVHVELAELIRVFPNIQLVNTKNEQKLTLVDIQADNLKSENNLLKEQLKHAHDREQWLKSQIDELRQQQSYLLEDKTSKKRKKFLGIF
ncbi:MAG: hypothetical protein ACK5Z5_06670 [Neisseriaceae bacterium]